MNSSKPIRRTTKKRTLVGAERIQRHDQSISKSITTLVAIPHHQQSSLLEVISMHGLARVRIGTGIILQWADLGLAASTRKVRT